MPPDSSDVIGHSIKAQGEIRVRRKRGGKISRQGLWCVTPLWPPTVHLGHHLPTGRWTEWREAGKWAENSPAMAAVGLGREGSLVTQGCLSGACERVRIAQKEPETSQLDKIVKCRKWYRPWTLCRFLRHYNFFQCVVFQPWFPHFQISFWAKNYFGATVFMIVSS